MGALSGKAVVITGAGTGIGEACARSLAQRGAAVVVNDIDAARAEAVVADIKAQGGQAVAGIVDIASWTGAEELITRCVREFGKVDGLVNNAGVIKPDRIDEIKEADLRLMLDVNVLGTAFCATHAARHMIARRQGSIVNVSSTSHSGAATLSGYAASKGAVASFTYSWAAELAQFGIRVNALLPLAATRMREINDSYRAGKNLPEHPSPTVSAQTNVPVVEYLLSDASANINGQLVQMTGSQLALFTHPSRLYPIHERQEWTMESIAEVFRTDLAQRQLPLGAVLLKAEVVPST